jgi:precorrin-6Y C5,15-methyltransferase (decarboxylating)
MKTGRDDAAFSTTGGLLTHREVRLLSLAELALQPGEVLWDIGAGSGAVSIEAAGGQPGAIAYAVERRAVMLEHIRENLRRFSLPNLYVVAGSAPDACTDLPDPHAVFVGGSGGHLGAIIALAQRRLYPGGRLVIALVTLENLQTARACLPDARVVQVQVSVGVPIVEMLRFEAHNPVFLVTWQKDEDGGGKEERCSYRW